jgi:hypothetical protein
MLWQKAHLKAHFALFEGRIVEVELHINEKYSLLEPVTNGPCDLQKDKG